MSNRGPPYPTNGVQAAVLQWIQSMDLELISLLLCRSWPMSILEISQPQWRPTEVTDTDNVVRMDRRQRLVRWDRRPPNEIFLEGFVPHMTNENTAVEVWEETDLYGFARNNHPSIFVSTTKTQRDKKNYVWTPRSSNRGIVYQYEIYAPGGVDVNRSFLNQSPWPNQMEVAFPGGVQNIYIRSARELHSGRIQRIWINPNFLDPNELEPIASSSRTLKVIWRMNHPDGGNKDSEGRSRRSNSDDDLMFGGGGDVEEDTFGDDTSNPKQFPDGEFMIESMQDTNLFLDLSQNFDGGIIHNHTYTGGENQIWMFAYDENKRAYKMKSKQNSTLLLSWNSNASSKEIILRGYTESGSDNQYWLIELTGDNNYKLRNVVNLDMVITAENTHNSFGGKDVIVSTNISQTKISQEWKIKPISFQTIVDGYYNIFNVDMPDKVVDFSNQNDVLIHGHTYNDYENQKWLFSYDGGKRAYKIWSAERSNLLLSWNSNAASKEMVLRAYTESGSKNQYWRIERTRNDNYKIRNLENLSLILMLKNERSSYGGLNLIVHNEFDIKPDLHSSWKIKRVCYRQIPDGDYNIFNQNYPNIAIDFSNQADSLVHGHNYLGNNNQQWIFAFDAHKNAYKIRSVVRSDLLLSWNSNAASAEYILRAYTESGSDNQYWRIENTDDGSYKLRNLLTLFRSIALTSTKSPYGGQEVVVSSSQENGNTWYIKNIRSRTLPNAKFRIATMRDYKKVIDSNQSNDLIVTNNLNLVTSEWKVNYDPTRKAYNIYSAGFNNLGWIYQNKNYFVKLGNIDGPDHGDWRYFWTIEYDIKNGCYLIRSLHDPSHAVGYVSEAVVTDTSIYSENQLFHFIPIEE